MSYCHEFNFSDALHYRQNIDKSKMADELLKKIVSKFKRTIKDNKIKHGTIMINRDIFESRITPLYGSLNYENIDLLTIAKRLNPAHIEDSLIHSVGIGCLIFVAKDIDDVKDMSFNVFGDSCKFPSVVCYCDKLVLTLAYVNHKFVLFDMVDGEITIRPMEDILKTTFIDKYVRYGPHFIYFRDYPPLREIDVSLHPEYKEIGRIYESLKSKDPLTDYELFLLKFCFVLLSFRQREHKNIVSQMKSVFDSMHVNLFERTELTRRSEPYMVINLAKDILNILMTLSWRNHDYPEIVTIMNEYLDVDNARCPVHRVKTTVIKKLGKRTNLFDKQLYRLSGTLCSPESQKNFL